ncbi:MAG: hypothetical protein BGO69_19460 [Bacteroidetes bacterium 46-16]|mgnify:CR=1 FL=1|nr:MAG: hypothetical protein BGO69_19460 [Bacteroidetes bacterium 46-16]
MGVIRTRNLAIRKLKRLIIDPSKVLIVHYSQLRTYDDEYGEISPLVSAIVIKSLDGSFERHFAVHLEADKANIPIEEIENSYRDLEFMTLKAFNEFVKRHDDDVWVHWDMKNIHFGFEAIKHRFEKIFAGLSKERYEEIPMRNKVNLALVLEGMYGEEYIDGPDKLRSLIAYNNGAVLDRQYLSLEYEGLEFENKNYSAVLNSLDCKTDFICKAVKLLSVKKLRVKNKNRYAIFIEIISHPLTMFLGLLIGYLLAIIPLL